MARSGTDYSRLLAAPIVAIAFGIAAISACGSGESVVSNTPNDANGSDGATASVQGQQDTPDSDGSPLTSEVASSRILGSVLRPPDRTLDPIPVDEARAVVGRPVDVDGSLIPAFLALATVDQLNIVDRPVWAFIQRGECGTIGYPNRGPRSPVTVTTVAGYSCIFVRVVDASSAEYLYGYSGPENLDAMVPESELVPPEELFPGDDGRLPTEGSATTRP